QPILMVTYLQLTTITIVMVVQVLGFAHLPTGLTDLLKIVLTYLRLKTAHLLESDSLTGGLIVTSIMDFSKIQHTEIPHRMCVFFQWA
ncbi:hypothetical protein DLY41_27525, partial [Escherichia coli]|nr:hypothetical protein [Escherichia coli]